MDGLVGDEEGEHGWEVVFAGGFLVEAGEAAGQFLLDGGERGRAGLGQGGEEGESRGEVGFAGLVVAEAVGGASGVEVAFPVCGGGGGEGGEGVGFGGVVAAEEEVGAGAFGVDGGAFDLFRGGRWVVACFYGFGVAVGAC